MREIGKGWLREEKWIKGAPYVVRIHERAMGGKKSIPQKVSREKKGGTVKNG